MRRTLRQRRQAGLTLVELLVSIALMTILTGSVVFVFIQAQSIFTHVDAKVQVYQNARTALDQMERDLANVVKTADMEFFNDTQVPSIGHYIPGSTPPMEIPIIDAADPDSQYNYAMTMRQPQPYTAFDGRPYRRDSIYFKTITQVEGETTAALIEYVLEDTTKERPKLVRKVWRVTGFDNSATPPKLIINGSKTRAGPDRRDLCYYVMNVEFALYMENKRTGRGGGYYTAQELCQPRKLLPSNVEPFPPEANFYAPPDFAVQTFYHPQHQDPSNPDYLIMEETDDGLMHTTQDFPFPMLKAGDRLYLSEVNPPDPSTASPFPRGDYTIKRFVDNHNNTGKMRIELAESFSFGALGTKNASGTTSPRRITLNYRAAWVPPAIRCVLKIKDAKAKELRTISRTFKVLAA